MEKQILHSIIYKKQDTVPLLIFHGLFGMLDNWATMGKKFAESNEVHLIDLRNHGRSFHSNEMSYSSMSEDIINYMEYYHLPKAILLGHSLGGKAVMECAVKHPEKVEKLIVVDIAPKAYHPNHQAVIEALKSVDFSQVKERKDVQSIITQYIHEPDVVLFLMKNVYRKENGNLDFRFNLKTLSENYNQLFCKSISPEKYKNKTLFVSGEKSNYILSEDEFYIKQQFPEEQIAVVPNAGHWVQADNPEAFYETVHLFLSR